MFLRVKENARRKVQRRKRVLWIWDEAVGGRTPERAGTHQCAKAGVCAFLHGLDRIIFKTLGPIAEQAKIAERYGERFSSEHTFYRKMRQDIRRPHMRLETNLAWRLHFRETLALCLQIILASQVFELIR